jgi:eukaryotic-like serine/threonine-protein kinase
VSEFGPEQDPGPTSRATQGRVALAVLGVGIAAFAVGFLFTAVFLFGGGPGDEVVTVPDLRGRTQAEAERLLGQANLTMEMGPILVNPEMAEGQVLAQSPLPGEEVAPGSNVRVTLSAGPERRPVPDVRSLSGEQARQQLVRYGFDVVLEEQTDPAPAGRLLEITPSPGTMLALPATVRLLVSSGPPLAEVPYVIGMREAEAREAIEAAGFFVSQLEYDAFAPQPVGTVIEQAPAGGGQARVGSGVRLTIVGSDFGNL